MLLASFHANAVVSWRIDPVNKMSIQKRKLVNQFVGVGSYAPGRLQRLSRRHKRVSMNSRAALRATQAAVFLLPLLAAVFFAYERSLHDQATRATVLADEVMRRGDITGDELFGAFTSLAAVAPADACGASNLERMRHIAIASPYLAGVGYIAGNALQCSSFGPEVQPIDVGPPDYISSSGYAVRPGRQLSSATGARFILSSAPNGFTIFFHPSLVLTLARPDEPLSFGVLGYSSRFPLMASGPVQFDWARLVLAQNESRLLIRDGSVVALHRSTKWDLFAYAAVPLAIVNAGFVHLLPIFLVVGLLAGIAAAVMAGKLWELRTSLQALLRSALRKNEIFVEYQPIVELRSGGWIGAEALARWRLRGGEMVPPEVFVALAEEHGLVQELTATVMTLALGHLAPLMTARPEFFITLNFSSNDLDNDRSISQLETMTARYGLDPGRVHIELTERSSVATDAHIAAISRLRSKGFEVGTDDFGVGFSNLEYLTRVPLDYLKIDRTLVASARDGSESRDIVETVVRLARSRGIRIIAEGVETEAQRLALLEAGVEYGQGWLFGRPMSALEFIAKFARFGGHRSAASRELVRILSMPRGSSAYR